MVHIGQLIAERLEQMHMTKSEFAKRMGMQQQNVNRILDDAVIKTDKLQQICDVLDFDFFRYYLRDTTDIHVVASGDSSIAAINSDVQTTDCAVFRERVRNLEQLLKEKERLIQYLMKDGRHDIQT